jgi:hypothetical protein
MEPKVTRTISPYVKKLSKVLKNFLLESEIFSIKKVDIVDISFKIDKDNASIDVKETSNTHQIDALVVDTEKFKKVLFGFYRKSKDKKVERLAHTVHKIEKQILKTLSEKHFLMASFQDYLFSIYDYFDERVLDEFLTKKEALCFYLLLSMLDTLHHNNKKAINEKYLYIFSEKEHAEDLLENYFRNLLSLSKVYFSEPNFQENHDYSLLLNMSTWTELEFTIEEKHLVRNKSKDKDSPIISHFINSSSELNTIYSLKNFSYSEWNQENYKNKRKYRFFDVNLGFARVKNVMQISLKYLNNGTSYLSKEEFDGIKDITEGNEIIYFTKSKELGVTCSNNRRYAVCIIDLKHVF